MKQHTIWLLIPLLMAGTGVRAQDTTHYLLRIYEDNDFINIRGLGTDEAYTNGTRIDLFYRKKHPSRWFVDRAMPRAGKGSEDVYGWGIMQLMFTPRDISQTAYQPDDYAYSGALLVSHTLYSYNPLKRQAIQTEILVGAIGPLAMAEQTQIGVHRLIHYQRPMGWSHQFKNDLLLNINITLEKQLAASGRGLELIGGSQVFAGTMLNGVAFYPMLRVGKMESYFRGFLHHYNGGVDGGRLRHRKKWQAYFLVKPEAQFIFTNAMLEGGMFTSHPNVAMGEAPADPATTDTHSGRGGYRHQDLRKWVGSINCGAVFSSGNFGISFIQSSATAMMKGSYSHEVGNVSLYFGW